MPHDTANLAHLMWREAACRKLGDTAGADEAAAALDAAAHRVNTEDWADTYRILVRTRHE